MNAVALVTGASRGIGAAAALALARQGCDVAVNYLDNEGKAHEVVRHIKATGQNAVALRADVSDYAQVQRLISQTVEQLGGLQILVNNAGYSEHSTLETLTPEAWRRLCAVTLDAAFYCAKEAAAHMKQARFGRVVNVCSLRAMSGSSHGAHYASAKAGLIGLTKSLALELAPLVTVNALSPGYTATDMNKEALATQGEAIFAKIPLHRAASPEEIGGVIAFLCSEAAGYITGETLNVNGGIYMG